MITTLLYIYLIGFVVTSCVASYFSGQEHTRIMRFQPQARLTINWVNNFFQSLMWFGFWVMFFAQRHTLKESPEQSAKALGLPEQPK